MIFEKVINYLPLKSTTNGLFFEPEVLRTSTASPVGEGEVVPVVVVGTEVGATQSKSLQG